MDAAQTVSETENYQSTRQNLDPLGNSQSEDLGSLRRADIGLALLVCASPYCRCVDRSDSHDKQSPCDALIIGPLSSLD